MRKISIAVILVSTVLSSTHTNALDAASFVRGSMNVVASTNSLWDDERSITGSEAEAFYAVERMDQVKAVENLKEQIEKLNQKQRSKKQEALLNSLKTKLSALEPESKGNKFCNELEDVCIKAFANNYFPKNKWKLPETPKGEAPQIPKGVCVPMEVSATFRKKSFDDTRQMLRCNIKNEKGDEAFLEASVRYQPGKKLSLYVLTKQNGKLKPIAFLMNKRVKVKEIKVEDAPPTTTSAGAGKTQTGA